MFLFLDDKFDILYKELYYRHLYAKVSVSNLYSINALSVFLANLKQIIKEHQLYISGRSQHCRKIRILL